jgi:hypothetical protein
MSGESEEIDRLREDCAQAYQVIGVLAHQAGVFDHPDTVKALDNMHAAADGEPRPHADLLPFGPEGPPRAHDARRAAFEEAAKLLELTPSAFRHSAGGGRDDGAGNADASGGFSVAGAQNQGEG